MRPTSPFCRVTVLAPRASIDVALPSDLPVAELVPMLAELAGVHGTPPGRPSPWCLAAAAGGALPGSATLGGLGVLDGDLLRLRLDAESPPSPVFDDPVDAVAQAGTEGAGGPLTIRPWTAGHTRAACAAAAVPAVLAGTVALVAVRGADPTPTPIAAAVAGLAAGFALAATRRWPGSAAAVPLGLAAVPLAAVTGPLAAPGQPGPGHLLLGTLLGGAAAAVALTLLRAGIAALVGVITVSTLTSAALLVCAAMPVTTTTGGPAACVAAVAMAVVPLLPRLSVRLAGLPPPVVAGSAAELLAADRGRPLSPAELTRRTRLAHDYLAGLVGGTSLVTAGGAALAALSGGWAGPTFAAVATAVLLMRARNYLSVAPVLTLLGCALVSGLAFLAAGTAPLDATGRLLGALGALAAAAALVSGSMVTTRRASPVLRRTLDTVAAVLVASAFPLALAALDLYRAVRAR